MPEGIRLAYLLLLKYNGFVKTATQTRDPFENKLEVEYDIVAAVHGAKYHLTLTIDMISGNMDARYGAESIPRTMQDLRGYSVFYGDYA